MVAHKPRSTSARSLAAWRGKNPVEKLLTRRMLVAERQIDHDDQRLFDLNSALVQARNDHEIEMRELKRRVHLLRQAKESAERNLADHELLIGSLANLLLHDREDWQRHARGDLEKVRAFLGEICSDKSLSATGSSKTLRNRNSALKSAT